MRIPVWVVAAAVVVVSLFTGVVVGVAVDRRVLFHRGSGQFVLSRGRWHGPMMPGRMEHDLGLSPAQSAAVDSVVHHRMAQRDSLMSRTFPVMRALLDSTRIDIERVLTPEQRAKFEKMRFRDGAPGVGRGARVMVGPDGETHVLIGHGPGDDGPPPPPPNPASP